MIIRLVLLAVTIVIPGGFLLLPAYLAYRAHQKRQAAGLDFDAEQRRAPNLKAPPPDPSGIRRALRKLSRHHAPLPG